MSEVSQQHDFESMTRELKSMMKNQQNIEESRLEEILKNIKSREISLQALRDTGIGRAVNDIRKSIKDPMLIVECKEILRVWRRMVEGQSTPKRKLTDEIEEPSVKRQAFESALSSHIQEFLAADLHDNNESEFRTRLKCREMLTKALHLDRSQESDDLAQIAIDIESTIMEDIGNTTSTKYRSLIRSRVFNLKDNKNPTLRDRVCNGEIEASRFARMSADELASDEMKRTRKQMTKEAIDEHQMAVQGGTATDMIKCGKCKKSNCTYNQVQTRSADEPMTTFVYCNECGHRWKFG